MPNTPTTTLQNTVVGKVAIGSTNTLDKETINIFNPIGGAYSSQCRN